MCSIGVKSGLQGELLLRRNTVVRSKSISNSGKTEYLVRFKSKYKTLLKKQTFENDYYILEDY